MFILVHRSRNGARELINTNWIEEIHETEDGGCTIHFSIRLNNAYLITTESFNEVMELLTEGKQCISRENG